MAAVQYYGTGRRKTSTARVFLRPGTGAVKINSKAFDRFFTTEALRTQILQPLALTETSDKFDILATVAGGGVSGQAGAVRLGIARALLYAPDFLFLDEATASLDEPAEEMLYRLLKTRLPAAAIISIGHRATLAAFHQRRLAFIRSGERFRVQEAKLAGAG